MKIKYGFVFVEIEETKVKLGRMKNGKKDGKWTYYNKDGSLKGDVIYKDGEIWNGLVVSYYENGQIFSEESYKDGKKDGKWITYFENGQIFTEENYKDGFRVWKAK